VRRRRSDDEDIDALNLQVLGGLRLIEPLWQTGRREQDIEIEHHIAGATVELWQGLRHGFGGGIDYKSRTSLPNTDQAMNDDRLTIAPRLDQIGLADFDYGRFCREIAPRVIEVFGAYRAAMVTDHERSVRDWNIVRHEMIEHNRSLDGRDGVLRIWPVSYFDDTLCQRAWGQSARDVVHRAAPACEEAYLLAGGAFLLVTSELIRGDALDDLSERVMTRLRR
jgi:hypothetical protein